MAIKERIPIDITFPTRVAMELKKRGVKDVDPKKIKVEAVRMVLIAETFKKRVEFEIGVKIDPAGMYAFCFISNQEAPLARIFDQPMKDICVMFGQANQVFMKPKGLELVKKILPPPLPKHLTSAQFRHVVVEVERWIKAVKKQIESVNP